MIPLFIKRLFSKGRDEQETQPAVPEPEKAGLPKREPQLYMGVSFATDTGLRRENNEDNYYIDGKYRHVYGQDERESYIELEQGAHTYGVFDGMGGEAFGESASALASVSLSQTAQTLREESVSDFPYYMNQYARDANFAICEMLRARGGARGGSTFVAVCVKDGYVYPFYIGDSRIYMLDGEKLVQITEDQTLAQRKVKAGVMTREEAETSPESHMLTCFLGVDTEEMGLDCELCMPIPVKHGLKILLCSDGLSDMCSRDEIAEILADNSGNLAGMLADKAIENGGRDNVTCVVLEFGESFV